MNTNTPVTVGVLEGLDRLFALATRPDTQAAIASLKKRYADRAAHEVRVRAAREEAAAAEADLSAHGYPHEPEAVVDEEVLQDLDARIHALQAARGKFREARDEAA
jgi:hypothetical protein